MNKLSTDYRIDFDQTQPIVCDKCGHNTFLQTYMLRKISAILSPNGVESITPIMVFECSACGHINENLLPDAQK